MIATSFIFPDIIWSNCGCCFAFLRCSLTSPPTPLPVLCHTGITVSALASTPHLSKPSGKYCPPWFTYYIAEIQNQRHLVKISIVFLSEQWALLLKHCLYWAKRYACLLTSTLLYASKLTTMTLLKITCSLSTWRGIKNVYLKKRTSLGAYKSCIQHSKHHKYLSLTLGIRSSEKYHLSLHIWPLRSLNHPAYACNTLVRTKNILKATF